MNRTIITRLGLGYLQWAWGKTNDIYLGIETGDSRHSILPTARSGTNSKYKDNIYYQAANYRNIRRVIRILNPGRDDLVYDIGSGKGRVVCSFARLPLRGVVGIDLDASLCDVARANAVRLRGRRSPIEIRCEDATRADLSDGTIYFMYNPFGTETMREVLDTIERSLSTNPRKVRIIYYNSVLAAVFLACQWLHQTGEFKTLTGRSVTFWSN